MQTEIEPIKVDVEREAEGFVVTLRGVDGVDTRVVFKQMFWLDSVIWKLTMFASNLGKRAPVLKVVALREPVAVEPQPVELRKIPFAA